MKNVISFAVKNPVTISMVVLAVLLLGKISYDRLNVDLLPDINAPRLFIEIEVGERPPEEIEQMFMENMESMAIRQRDVTQVSSIIKAGSARLTVEYVQNKDMDEAFLDMQRAMAAFGTNSDIQSINITQHDPNTAPVMLIAMSHRTITDMAELRRMAEGYVRNEIVRLPGVAEVALSGQERTVLTINTDPHRLNAFGLTVDEIASRIESNNQSISGGRVSDLGLQYLVKSTTQFANELDFENLIVSFRATETRVGAQQGSATRAPVFLREVASVRFENERPDNIVRLNGVRCIGLSVYKEMQQNTVRVVDQITNQLTQIEQALPGYNFEVISNQGTFIKEAINEVKNTAIYGMLLAVMVLFVFLRRVGTTLIVSLAIPVSIVATFNMMYFNGLTLNIMTLGGLALGGGMLIDNAIVVIESIFRNHERGLSRREAIITGASEVSGVVIASTITTIVVFLPIVYIHGASGALFKDQAWTVAFSLVSSLFVALLVIPTLYDRLTIRKAKNEEIQPESRAIQFNWYSNILKSVLKARWIVIGASVALLGGTLLILPLVGTEFLPRSESKMFTVLVKLPEGTRLERTDAVMQNLEFLIYSISGDTLATVYTHAGRGSSENEIFEGEHSGVMRVILSKSSPLPPQTVIARFVDATHNIEGLELIFKQEENTLGVLFGGDETAPIVVEIRGDDLNQLAAITDEVLDRLDEIPGIFNVNSSMADGAPELTVSLDRTVAGINNISASTVINQIRQQLQGRDAGKMDYRGEMRDIVIKKPDITVRDLNGLVISSGNQEFLLREIAHIERSYAPKEIFRRNQNRINKIVADKELGVSLDRVAHQIREAVSDVPLPESYTITVTGEEERRLESMRSLMFALILSIVLVYMVLASQFESLLHPFTILLTIPLALVGAVLIFAITGTTINIMGIIGTIMLAGIAVNNSIILVGRINQLKTTMELKDAIVLAGQQRIRPIVMTSLTTILALLPMSFNIGEGAALRSSMAMAVIGGLITSMLMSLVVIPCVYYVFEEMKRSLIKE